MKSSEKNDNNYTALRSVSIVIPAFNEEKHLPSLIQKIQEVMERNSIIYEIICVDDRSTDKTKDIIKSIIDKEKIPLIYHVKQGKQGKAFSLLEGFKMARYELVCMIDADLQYSPEAIPAMIHKISGKIGIVVANRTKLNTSLHRQIMSRCFQFLFGQILHGLTYDIQSGLKVMKKEIFARLTFAPQAWTLDLELLIKARHAGYEIDTVDIQFEERKNDKARINLILATIQMSLQAILLKLQTLSPVPFLAAEIEKKGHGFHYNGVEFVHHTALHFAESAFQPVTHKQKLILLRLLAILITGLLLNWPVTVTICVFLITCIYFADLFFNLFLIIRSFSGNSIVHITPSQLSDASDISWPTYTILCPLYKEWYVLPQFVTAMSRLDYPKDKLQIMLLLEEDDTESIAHIKNYQLPANFDVIIVPHTKPKTKPKALNYGLRFARGEYIVVYDAEDIPDSLQLKKAVLAFNTSSSRIGCMQAKLNFYNPHQNIITRIFTAEYSLWFDLILTGLQSIVAPIPLGGTSNHFRISVIKELHGWDSFNVTEDCDLGIRLVKHGYQTAMINSTTLEEANSNLFSWINQRSRWIKGYIQTYFTHMREPTKLLKSWKEPHLLSFQLIVGGKVLSMFINPFMWIATIAYFLLHTTFAPIIQRFFPTPVLYMGVFSLVIGNFLYMYYYMIGCATRGHYSLIKFVFLVPLYWICMSFAAWKALIQFIVNQLIWNRNTYVPDKLIDTIYSYIQRLRWERVVIAVAFCLSVSATAYFLNKDLILAYGDAESHLNIAKRVIDGLTPGFAQLGGIWLPLPHIFMIPFVSVDWLWRTGLAGSIVSGICFIIASLYVFKFALLLTKNKYIAFLSFLIFASNPNILYLQSTPMTEIPLLMFFIVSGYYFVRYIHNQNDLIALLLAAFFGFCAALSRYDGWFLVGIEGSSILLLWFKHKEPFSHIEGKFVLFCTLAFFGVVMWLGWDAIILGDPFYFTNSLFSAKSQQQNWLLRHELPGYHNLFVSLIYYVVTTMSNSGILLFLIALVGIYVFLRNSKNTYRFFIILILFVPFIFNVITLFLGQSVIFIPDLTPVSFEWRLFNVRYGVLMIPAIAFFIAYAFYQAKQPGVRLLIIGFIICQFVLFGIGYSRIITVTDGTTGLSHAKRPDAEKWLKDHYNNGLLLLDDYSRTVSIIRSGIPMKNVIYIGNKPYWEISLQTPEKYAKWIVMQKDDAVWKNIYSTTEQQSRLYKYYTKVYTSPDILIFERNANIP